MYQCFRVVGRIAGAGRRRLAPGGFPAEVCGFGAVGTGVVRDGARRTGEGAVPPPRGSDQMNGVLPGTATVHLGSSVFQVRSAGSGISCCFELSTCSQVSALPV